MYINIDHDTFKCLIKTGDAYCFSSSANFAATLPKDFGLLNHSCGNLFYIAGVERFYRVRKAVLTQTAM